MSFPPTTPGVVQLSNQPGTTIQYFEALFTEAGQHTYTAKFPVMPGGMVLDVIVGNQVLWADADLTVGDDVTANCFVASTAVDATPTVDGTAVEGVDMLYTKAGLSKRYPNGGNVVAVITSVTAGAGAGRTTVGVVICVPDHEVAVVVS